MTLMHLKPSVVLLGAVALLMSGCVGFGCTSRTPVAPVPVAGDAGTGLDVQAIIVIDQSELDRIRASYVVSESKGEITGLATCESGTADDACTAAARLQLREEAKKRGLGLVVIIDTALRQTFPPQISLRATLHQITPR